MNNFQTDTIHPCILTIDIICCYEFWLQPNFLTNRTALGSLYTPTGGGYEPV